MIELPTASATIAEGKRLLLHGDQQRYRIWYSKPTGRVLHVEGMITDGIAEAVAHAIGTSPATRLVVLHSPGGSAQEGMRLAAVIKEQGLDTGVDQYCESACTLAFMGGVQRVLFPPDGRLGFHGCHDRLWFSPCDNRDFKAFLVAAGVDADFVRKGWSIDPQRLWYPTADELIRAGVVTKLGTVTSIEQSGSVQAIKNRVSVD